MDGVFEFADLTAFTPKTITQLYGEPASGKSNLCMLAAADVARSGKTVVFIDTEGSFSLPRFRQVAGHEAQELLKRIIIAEPTDFDEQKIAVNKIEDLVASRHGSEAPVGLIVVDSLVSLYRLEMGLAEAAEANKELSRQMGKLMSVATKHDIPVVITNQVYSAFSREHGDEAKLLLPVGGDVLKYWAKVVINVRKAGEYRVAEVIRHVAKPEGGKIRFRITQFGIKDEGSLQAMGKQTPPQDA